MKLFQGPHWPSIGVIVVIVLAMFVVYHVFVIVPSQTRRVTGRRK